MLIYYFYINGTYVTCVSESFVVVAVIRKWEMVVYLILIISFSFQKQLNSLNKITSNLLDIINSSKDEWENDASK